MLTERFNSLPGECMAGFFDGSVSESSFARSEWREFGQEFGVSCPGFVDDICIESRICPGIE
jgi:hypothetical protein